MAAREMSDLRIRHHVRLDFEAVGDCVWCGAKACSMAETPFRPDLGQVPLHLLCGAQMREAFRAYRDGVMLTPDQALGMSFLRGRIGA